MRFNNNRGQKTKTRLYPPPWTLSLRDWQTSGDGTWGECVDFKWACSAEQTSYLKHLPKRKPNQLHEWYRSERFHGNHAPSEVNVYLKERVIWTISKEVALSFVCVWIPSIHWHRGRTGAEEIIYWLVVVLKHITDKYLTRADHAWVNFIWLFLSK